MDDSDEFFMEEALAEAFKAFEEGEVPVGAVAVRDGKIVARAFNRVEGLQDASAHAEILCLRETASLLGNWRLSDVTLYSTLEPCCMCAGALSAFRLKRLVWGAPDIRLGGDGSFLSVLSAKHPMHEIIVSRGVLADRSADLMRSFFKKRRSETDGRDV